MYRSNRSLSDMTTHHCESGCHGGICLAITFAALLGGRAYAPPEPESDMPADAATGEWHAPLPHGGQLAELHRWWARFDDPLLSRLIRAAERASPTVGQASANLANARALRIGGGAALQPVRKSIAGAGRGAIEPPRPAGTLSSLGMRASWELDWLDANRAEGDGAQPQAQPHQAGWHAARVSVAAEVAMIYTGLRVCEAQLVQLEKDLQSRVQISRLTAMAVDAGLATRAKGHAARAGVAQGQSLLAQQRSGYELWIQALVALCGQHEDSLREQLAHRTALLPHPVGIQVAAIPAEVLAQRPDIEAAAREVAAASADVAPADARPMSRIALAGTIGIEPPTTSTVRTHGTIWQVGPVAVTMPAFEGGRLGASAKAARTRYQAATTRYAARLREAIREVQSTLVGLDGAAKRSAAARAALDGATRCYVALQSSYEAGTASLLELEDARRGMIAAQRTLVDIAGEQVLAWIALYRATGGAWEPVRPPIPEHHQGRTPTSGNGHRDRGGGLALN